MENMPEKPTTNKRKRRRSGTKLYHHLLIALFVLLVLAMVLIVYDALQTGLGHPVSGTGQTVSSPTQSQSSSSTEPSESESESTEPTEPPTEALEPEELVSIYMDRLTLEEKVWQMMFVTADQLEAVNGEQYPVGGLYFCTEDLTDVADLEDQMFAVQATAQTPVMFGLTHEGGNVAPLTNLGLVDATSTARAYGDAADTNAAYQAATIMGKQIAAAGFHFNLAPIADTYNWYPNEAFDLQNRTFGTNEAVASGVLPQMVAQMVKGMQEGGTIACLKHFPNFASTAPSDMGDFSWLSYEKFSANDFLPFTAGIDAGVQMVLVSNMYAPNLTAGLYVPCCRAKEVVTDILRTELGFNGVVLTDDQRQQTDAANFVSMVQAGCDVIYLPSDPKAAVDAILAAVDSGAISQERIEESVYRILLLKCENGIILE